MDVKLLQEMANEGITAVYCFWRKTDDVLTPPALLTFKSPVLPPVVHCAWYNLLVKKYISNPRRYFHCHSFGHVPQSCWRLQKGLPPACVSCGGNHMKHCPGQVKCFHCDGAHPTSSRACVKHKFEREILLICIQERRSFPEANVTPLTRSNICLCC